MDSPGIGASNSVQDRLPTTTALSGERAGNLAAITAALLGVVMLFGAGFAPSIAHKQGHDARHTMGFVCH